MNVPRYYLRLAIPKKKGHYLKSQSTTVTESGAFVQKKLLDLEI